jgi:hypothetical protein
MNDGMVSVKYYSSGGITVRVGADLPITALTFHRKFDKFLVTTPGADVISLHHHFTLPGFPLEAAGNPVYDEYPWKIYHSEDTWTYFYYTYPQGKLALDRAAVFDEDHRHGKIYSASDQSFRDGNIEMLTQFPTDQLLFARVLPDRSGFMVHSSALRINRQGFLFAGHSGAGKTTLVRLLREHGEVLCDERNIIRRFPHSWQLFGTWNHGDVADISPMPAPLRAVIFIEQASQDRLIPIENRQEIVRLLPFYIVKPLVTADWWEKTLDLVGQVAREVPVYRLQFTKSERVVDTLRPLFG